MADRHARILGALWAVVGGLTLIYVVVGFWVIVVGAFQRVGYNILPLFLAFIMLPFGIAALINGIGGLSRGHLSRARTIFLSLVIIVAGGLYLLPGTTSALRFSPIAEVRTEATRAIVVYLFLSLLGLYSLGVMALRPKGGR
jgi:uncharacterized membrane protein